MMIHKITLKSIIMPFKIENKETIMTVYGILSYAFSWQSLHQILFLLFKNSFSLANVLSLVTSRLKKRSISQSIITLNFFLLLEHFLDNMHAKATKLKILELYVRIKSQHHFSYQSKP